MLAKTIEEKDLGVLFSVDCKMSRVALQKTFVFEGYLNMDVLKYAFKHPVPSTVFRAGLCMFMHVAYSKVFFSSFQDCQQKTKKKPSKTQVLLLGRKIKCGRKNASSIFCEKTISNIGYDG